MRHFPFNNYILEACGRVFHQNEYSSDRYLRPIVMLQRFSEQVDDIVTNSSAQTSLDDINCKISSVRRQIEAFKENMPFPFSDSRESFLTSRSPLDNMSILC